jgi:hypothetical protein
MKKRVRRKSLAPTQDPRNLAKRLAEVQALRQLVRIAEKESSNGGRQLRERGGRSGGRLLYPKIVDPLP